MDTEPARDSPAAILDELRSHPEWSDRQRDAILDRLVERFPIDELITIVLDRLSNLAGPDAEVLLRLVEANPRPELLKALAVAVAAQPDLPPERAWDALAVLDGAGVLDDHRALADRWEELNEVLDETGSIEELADQIEGDPEGIWLAIQGLVAVEPDVRPEIVAGLARTPLGPGLVEFFRLLAYSHDEATRRIALAALSAGPERAPGLQEAWLDIAAHHTDSSALATARNRLGGEAAGLPARRTSPRLVSAVVSSIDGRGRGTIVLSASNEGKRATAAFVCDVEQGVTEIGGDVEPDSPDAGATFEEMSAGIGREMITGPRAGPLALNLLAGSLWLSGPATPPSWRFWVEKTVGPLRPGPFRTGFPDLGSEILTPSETAERSRAVLDACPDWLDASPLTYEMAEEILLREGQNPPDPKRDAGAYRYLFEHRLKDRLETYRRMLFWMAEFWGASSADGLALAALALASQLSDAQHAVPGHPFTVAFTTRSLAAAQQQLRSGIDPRPRNRR